MRVGKVIAMKKGAVLAHPVICGISRFSRLEWLQKFRNGCCIIYITEAVHQNKRMGWPQRGRSAAMGTSPKLGWDRGGVMSTKTSNISLKWCMTGPTLLRRSNRKSHTRFQLVPKSVTLNDLERPKRTLAEKIVLWREIWTKVHVGPNSLSAAKCRAMILVSRNVWFVWIFAGVP